MSAVDAMAAVLAGPPLLTRMVPAMPAMPALSTVAGAAPAGAGFADILSRGVAQVEQKLDVADDMVRRLALGEEMPIHQVSYALEQARLSVELAMQVRARLLDGYRELMNLQL